MSDFKITTAPPEKRFEARLRNGETPSPEEAANLLDELGEMAIPEKVRSYIAALLRGSIKRKRGPKGVSASDKFHRDIAISVHYRLLLKKLQAIRKTDGDEAMRKEAGYDITSKESPSQIASEIVAEAVLGNKGQAQTVRNIASSHDLSELE